MSLETGVSFLKIHGDYMEGNRHRARGARVCVCVPAWGGGTKSNRENRRRSKAILCAIRHISCIAVKISMKP